MTGMIACDRKEKNDEKCIQRKNKVKMRRCKKPTQFFKKKINSVLKKKNYYLKNLVF